MRTVLTKQQTEAINRLAVSPDGKSFLRLLQSELDAAIGDLVDATEEPRFRAVQGEVRALREILATADAAVLAVRGKPPANPYLAGGRPNHTGNPDRLPDDGGM